MVSEITFYKYQGTGNDFIIIDNRNGIIQLNQNEIYKLCHRRFGVGADGLMMLKTKSGYDFEMDFYNSDGNPGSMCGNGGRCIVAFARDLGIISNQTRFWAPDGEHEAFMDKNGNIALKMQEPHSINTTPHGLFMNTGSPHLVIIKPQKQQFDAFTEGKALRYHHDFMPGGTNVNFLQSENENHTIVTYERGVEDLTLSCGTGTVAAALALNIIYKIPSPIEIKTPGGLLKVSFDGLFEKYNNIWLIGPAQQSFIGTFKFEIFSKLNF